jgi:DNA-binding beta-propeller fold protein YncE
MRRRVVFAMLIAACMIAGGLTPSPVARAKAARPGTQKWASRDAGAHGAYDQLGGMVESPDGSSVYVARSSNGVMVVVAHDAATGAPTWSIRVRDPLGAQVFAHSAAVSPDGSRLFVTAEVERSVDTRSMMTVGIDVSSRTVLWAHSLLAGRHRSVVPRRVAVSPDGTRVFVTGSTTGTHGSEDVWDYLTVGYAAATGVDLWSETYDAHEHGGDTAEGLGVSPDGSKVFVTGTSRAAGPARDIVTIAYRATDGRRVWTGRYRGGVDDFATDLAVSPDGMRVYVAGFGRASLALPHGFRVVALDADSGALEDVGRFADGGDDFANDVVISPDGSRLFVTGSGGGDFLTVAFRSAKLSRLWSARYDGGHGVDNAYGIAVDPSGANVYVTGESETGRAACFGDIRSTAFATVQYDADTGTRGWVSRYAGLKKHPDQGLELAVSPDGSLVYVFGNSDFACNSSDVATVAYTA